MSREKPKVLIVDDDPDDVKLIMMILEPEGYEVVSAGNGAEALEKVEAESPDLVLLDVMMPEMDGFAACAKLKASPEHRRIPVILLTAVAQHISDTKYPLDGVVRAEADDYLEKPVKPEVLLERVAQILA